MSYTAPVRDLLFVCTEIADLDGVSKLPGYEESTADLLAAVLEEAGKFGSEVLAPINYSGDQQGARLVDGQAVTADGWKEAYSQFVESGWNSLPFDSEYGGQGLPWIISTAVNEIWHAANMAFSLCPLLTQGAIEAILAHGTDQQKQTYLAKMVSGEWTGTMNLTEPQAGSDLAAVKTRAKPDGDHYRITGQKIFITYGDHDMTENIIHLVLARTPDAPEGVKGISLFIVPKFLQDDSGNWTVRNDAGPLSLEHKLGIHASPTAVMGFGDDEGAIGYLVGEENQGLMYMFTMMNVARHAVGVQGYAVAERAYQQAVIFANDRVQGKAIDAPAGDRVNIINHPDVQRLLWIQKCRNEALRSLGLVAASCMDKSERSQNPDEKQAAREMVDILIPIVKGYSTEIGLENVSLALQVHGGMGFIEETGAAQHYRDQRITPIYEGTTGIQAMDLVGRKLGRDGGQMTNRVVGYIRQDIDALESLPESMKKTMLAALDALSATATRLAEQSVSEAKKVAAVAEPYLRLWGVVACGWQLAKAVNASNNHINAGSDDAFYRTKIKTAEFYFATEMPKVQCLVDTINGSADLVCETNISQFNVA